MLYLITGIILLGLLIIFMNSPGKLPPLKDAQGNVIKGSISEKMRVEINGIKQGMFIRGENTQNPVILYLHGGPGTPMLQFITYLEKEERPEEYFTVCYWDQRGSGMTYDRLTSVSTMTVAQLVEDTRAVTEYLQSRFGQNKIYLIGHSWGSYLGVKTIEKYPENYLAYIGIGQVTNQAESERSAYNFMLNRAKEINDQEMIEKVKWLLGADFSMVHLFPAVLDDNLFLSSTTFEVPFYIVQGDFDYMVSQALAEKYLDVIDAPAKEYFSFSNSAHSPNMEESEKFIEIFRKIALENPSEK